MTHAIANQRIKADFLSSIDLRGEIFMKPAKSIHNFFMQKAYAYEISGKERKFWQVAHIFVGGLGYAGSMPALIPGLICKLSDCAYISLQNKLKLAQMRSMNSQDKIRALRDFLQHLSSLDRSDITLTKIGEINLEGKLTNENLIRELSSAYRQVFFAPAFSWNRGEYTIDEGHTFFIYIRQKSENAEGYQLPVRQNSITMQRFDNEYDSISSIDTFADSRD